MFSFFFSLTEARGMIGSQTLVVPKGCSAVSIPAILRKALRTIINYSLAAILLGENCLP